MIASTGEIIELIQRFDNARLSSLLQDQHCDVAKDAAPLIAAARVDNVQAVEVLLLHHADCRGRDEDGWTALHTAAHSNSMKACAVLATLDVTATTDAGLSALHIASSAGNCAIACCLIQYGSDVNMRDKFQETPLLIAAMNGDIKMISILVAAGANPSLCNDEGVSFYNIAKYHCAGVEMVCALMNTMEGELPTSELWHTIIELKAYEALARLMCRSDKRVVSELLLEEMQRRELPHCVLARLLCMSSVNRLSLSTCPAEFVTCPAEFVSCLIATVQCLSRRLPSPCWSVIARVVDRVKQQWVLEAASSAMVFAESIHAAVSANDMLGVRLHAMIDVDALCHQGKPALFQCLATGDLSMAQELIALGASVEITLSIALQCNHRDVIYLLITQGHIKDVNGRILRHACTHSWNNDDVATIIDVADADVASIDEDGRSSLFLASWKGCLRLVQLLIFKYYADVSLCKTDGSSCLYIACCSRRLEVMRVLLDAGADVNRTRHDNTTALHVAAQRGWVDGVRLLMEAKAHTNIATKNGRFALDLTGRHGDMTIINLLCDHGGCLSADSSLLTIAAERGHGDVIRRFVDAVTIDQCGQGVVAAARFGQHLVIDILLNGRRHNVSLPSPYLLDAMLEACRGSSDRVIHQLYTALSHSTSALSHSTSAGSVIVHKDWVTAAMHNPNVEILQTLISLPNGASIIGSYLEHGDNVLHMACRRGSASMVALLVQCASVAVNARSTVDGLTPLLIAVKGECVDVAQVLVAHSRVDINARSDPLMGGKSLLHVILETAQVPVFLAMVSQWLAAGHAIDVNAVDAEGYTPLLRAASTGNELVFRQLLGIRGCDLAASLPDGSTVAKIARVNGYSGIVMAVAQASTNML